MENFGETYLKFWIDFCAGAAFGAFLCWLSEVVYGTTLVYFAMKLFSF